MHDFTVVEFPKLGWSFNVPSILADFTIPGINLHLTIHWYGVIIAFGFLLAVLLGGRMAYKWKMSLDKMVDVLIFGTFGGIIGARLFYVIFEWEQYKDHLLDILNLGRRDGDLWRHHRRPAGGLGGMPFQQAEFPQSAGYRRDKPSARAGHRPVGQLHESGGFRLQYRSPLGHDEQQGCLLPHRPSGGFRRKRHHG